MADQGGTQQVVVVGVDGSAESIAALGWARNYATAAGAKVRAVRPGTLVSDGDRRAGRP